MTQITGIKNWFLEKSGFSVDAINKIQKQELIVIKETEKAVLSTLNGKELWIPKSCLTEA